MKKALILLAVLTVGAMATAQEVKIKRGKVTMSEADYNLLKRNRRLMPTNKPRRPSTRRWQATRSNSR